MPEFSVVLIGWVLVNNQCEIAGFFHESSGPARWNALGTKRSAKVPAHTASLEVITFILSSMAERRRRSKPKELYFPREAGFGIRWGRPAKLKDGQGMRIEALENEASRELRNISTEVPPLAQFRPSSTVAIYTVHQSTHVRPIVFLMRNSCTIAVCR